MRQKRGSERERLATGKREEWRGGGASRTFLSCVCVCVMDLVLNLVPAPSIAGEKKVVQWVGEGKRLASPVFTQRHASEGRGGGGAARGDATSTHSHKDMGSEGESSMVFSLAGTQETGDRERERERE
eukprot:Sspe_Gene.81080::Locus_51625_Transcript_1_1_Confidence_1.000_Length_524::g.81080::m.81080